MILRNFMPFLLLVALNSAACVPIVSETESQIDAFAAGTTPPDADTRQGDLANCEVKSNKNEPCLIDDKGAKATTSGDRKAIALAIPFPPECKVVSVPNYHPDENEAAVSATINRAAEAGAQCRGYMFRLEEIYPDGKNMPKDVAARYKKADDTFFENFGNTLRHSNQKEGWIEDTVVRRDPTPQPSASAPSGSGSGTCANPFGGNAAPDGQFICSDQGELQACQCSGGSCDLVPTGSFLCTSPGAVIR